MGKTNSKIAKKKANPKKNEILKKKGLHKDLSSSKLKIFGDEYYFNYELSWLKFNERVLAEAGNEKNKILDRVKFLSIVCSNLDEFFQKRVGGLKRQLLAGVQELSVDGRTPAEQLTAVRKEVLKMVNSYRSCYFHEILPKLSSKGLRITDYGSLRRDQQQFCDLFFEKQIFPIITPLAVDESHPFPFISNKSLSFAIELEDPKTKERHFARLKIPANRSRFIEIERSENSVTLIPIEEVILHKMNVLFPGMTVISAHLFRVIRNASIDRNEEEAEDLLEFIEGELRERKFAQIVRLDLDVEMPETLKQYLISNLKVEPDDIYEMAGTIGLADLMELSSLSGFNRLRSPEFTPALHPSLEHGHHEQIPSIFDAIKAGDFIVHHPYHSFQLSTQQFIEEAARDPKVLAIKQTLYRTSENSPIMHSLMNAAELGKNVAVLVEIKARFDEERNITWAQKLEDVGVHVGYGIHGLKIHTKLTMVVREEEDGLRTYCHIGTGNYNPDTANLYEDMALFTCDEQLGSDVTKIFNLLTGYAPDQVFDKLVVAPGQMRTTMNELIEHEIAEAKSGRKARIIAKMNSLEDPLIIQKLYEASGAGVKIDLIVRGVCRLIPGKEGLSEHITVHSIIGQYLEHSRIYFFHHGGTRKYFIGSADWMHRNLDARVEALVPIEAEALKDYLQFILHKYLQDNRRRWLLQPDGNYTRAKKSKDEAGFSIQEYLGTHAKTCTDPVPRA